ncbi:MAG: lipid-A-disaccharide synthase [Geminicoccaceae bacterium]
MTGSTDAAHVFLLAGEPSGDIIGARLMDALRRRQGFEAVTFSGVGGPRMGQQGLDSLFPMDELSLMGFAEVLPHIPRLLRRLSQARREIAASRPDMVLTIDSPSFSLRLQQRLAGLGPKRVHYVAPQVWAWRKGRAAKLGMKIDHLLALLPFEPPIFRRHGLDCSFVGHPIIEEAGRKGDGGRFRRRYELPDDAPILCLLPGSRRHEIQMHMPVLEATVTSLWRRFPRLRLIMPTLPSLAPRLREMVENWPLVPLILDERADRFDAYAASMLAIAASGTVTLELALANLPHVTIYRTGSITGWLARRMVQVEHVNLVNLILNRPAVPELLLEDCIPDRVAGSAMPLIEDQSLRQEQKIALDGVCSMLGGDGSALPSDQAADCVINLLGRSEHSRSVLGKVD